MRIRIATLITLLTSTLAFAPAGRAEAPAALAVTGGLIPDVDTSAVTLFADQARVELRGARLAGARVRWRTPTATGEGTCVEPKPAGKLEQCSVAVARDLPAGASFGLLPPATPGEAPAPIGAGIPLRPSRIVLDRLLPIDAVVDLTSGVGRVPIVHPEAIASVDCAPARCELADTGIAVRAVAGAAAAVNLHLRLSPGYFVAHGDATETSVTRTVAITHCASAIVSGPPLRLPDAARLIVRIEPRCGRDAPALRWSVNGSNAEVQRVEPLADGVYVQLGVRGIDGAQATVLASRPDPDDTVVVIARADTRAVPQVKAVLELAGHGKIGFLPTNRDAILRTTPAGDAARLIPLPIEGAYHVTAAAKDQTRTDQSWLVRGEESAGGFVELRFGYRVVTLPPPFAATDLAVLTEPLQRPIHEANVPAPLGSSVLGDKPLVELLCADGGGQPRRIAPGARASVPYAQRDSCHLVIHRERLSPEDGAQDVTVEVNVTKVDESTRAESRMSQRMLLRATREPRVVWLRGVRARFDRMAVQIAQVEDESRDLGKGDGGGDDGRAKISAAQWAIVFGEGHLRFYATAAIPTGLFRISAPSDVLTLNFGALARVTWLTSEGREGLIGLELGALGIGLAATPGFPRTLAVLGGVGVAIPIGNRGETSQASVNLHAWVAYELRDEYHLVPTDPTSPLARHWSFLFGPSITIGNVGANI